jgi:outer membrane protein TolC
LHKAFAALLYAQAEIEVSKRIKALREGDAKMVSLRYDSGTESKGNMLRSKAQLLEADVGLAQARRDIRSAQQELNHQLGREDFQSVRATGSYTTGDYEAAPPSMELLMKNHPFVQLREADLMVAKGNVKQAESVFWPNLSATYVRSFQGSDDFPGNPAWSASGILSYPIFGGGPASGYFSVMEAKRSREKAEQDLLSARMQTRSNLESYWSSLESSLDQVKLERAFLDAARQRNGEADIRYGNGLLTFDNWELIVTDRVNFERAMIRAEQNAANAEAQWDQSIGKGIGD